MQELKIIVDQRERNVELIGALEGLGFEVAMETMPVGDYVISDRICVERKTVSDFESSIINGRLFEQLEMLKLTYKFPILMLEGDRETFRLKRNVITGTIVSVYVDYGIPVIFSDSPQNSAEIMAVMAKREQNGKKRAPSMKGSTRAYTNEQFQEYIIGNLPGIGMKLAKSLLRHFGSVKAIANANVKQLMKVEKIGKKKAELIHKTFNHRYSAD
jgi:ERCC4-type nuclease